MENVENILITAEVAKLLDYETVHVIRVAKELLNQGIITNRDFRSAGLRTYLFNKEALRQLRIKLKCPTFFLIDKGDSPSEIHELYYRDLEIVNEDLIILNDESEKIRFQTLVAAVQRQQTNEATELYEDYIQEKESLGECLMADDTDGGISYIKLDQAIREGKAYFLKEFDLVEVKLSDLRGMTTVCEQGIVWQVVEKISDNIFKTADENYYRLNNVGYEAELIRLDDNRIKYWMMDEKEVIEEIAKDFELKIEFDKIDYWDNQPVFVAKNGKKISINELKIKDNTAFIQTRNISEILDEVMMLD